ncbi:hypothetical protein CPB85DRAFT_1327098 [Mucidula mucida]|nr:hypothetical protein CPB85DRAFT_1327098 [Mucidula mucida]
MTESLHVDLFRVLVVFAADLIMIRRCWTLYDRDLKVIAIPTFCLIAEPISVYMALVSAWADVASTGISPSNWLLLYYSMTLATNTLCTFLILFRSSGLKTDRGLDAVIYIALLLAYAHQFYTGTALFDGIAPAIIITRFIAGKSRPGVRSSPPDMKLSAIEASAAHQSMVGSRDVEDKYGQDADKRWGAVWAVYMPERVP